MKTPLAATFPISERWDASKSKFRLLFTRLTGYDIMFEETRKDLGSSIIPIIEVLKKNKPL